MFADEACERLQLDHDTPEADEVRRVGLLEPPALVVDRQNRLRRERNVSSLELQRETLLINSLQEAGAQHTIDLKDRTLNPEHLVRMQNSFVWFVWFVDHS